MKRDAFTLQLDLGRELIVDNFAGGGGTSTGLEAAFGRPVDIAINHDPEALAMHAMNHPHTKHLCESVWNVDPIKVTNNQPVGLVWLSPDCKHFSKAKGGKPVEKNIRGLAWVALRWVAKCKPRAIMLENVEEFQTWGPLKKVVTMEVDSCGDLVEKVSWLPDPKRRGKTFKSFIRQLKQHGYEVDYRELRACDYGAPTIRKRFFLVARRDGLPIRWPEPTHGAPVSPAVLAGTLQPYRTAAECIDWSLPCPSIFERTRELAPATLRRIAKGIMRYVINAERPFIVPLTHQGADRVESIDEPMRTVTGAQRGEKALASATLVQVGYGERAGQAPRAVPVNAPLGTIVGTGKHALVTAFLNEHANSTNQRVMPADEPLRTICAQVKGGHFSVVSADLAPFVVTNTSGHPGAASNSPLPTVTAAGNQLLATAVLVDAAHADVSPTGVKRWGAGVKPLDEPLGTVLASGNKAVATAFLAKHYTGVVGSELATPIGTVTAADHHSLVTAHLTKFRTGSTGAELTEPVPTITAGPKENPAGAPHALGIVTSNLVKLRGTSSAAATDEPLHTISAGGQHHAEVRAFLLKYYGTDQDPQLADPLHTVTTKDRYGLVTIHGQDYQIVDIGLRMLAPPELYRAQSFPRHYVIKEIPDPTQLFVNGVQVAGDVYALPRVPLTKSAQVRMCGNSVPPKLAEALVRVNFAHEAEWGVAA